MNTPTASGVIKPEKGLPRKPDKIALTPEQCVGIGGKVLTTYTCDSGYMCNRADQDGVIHRACIDEKK